MARNEIVIDASPEAVYDTLLDAHAYPQWVVGAKELRGVDPGWPKKGRRFHHRVGAGPVTLADSTKLVDKKRNRLVVLEVRACPLGTGRVTLTLKPKRRGRSTRVTMTETLTGGPLAWVRKPVITLGLKARNVVALRRLRRLVASRACPTR